ncbi:MAG TPA: hypothetical protein VGI17_08490 [Solirubrobacterales bacterium]|jgi:cytoskeletal protein RodZ
MDPIEKRELKRQAWRRLAAQRRRAGLLRGRVVAISLICFAVLWGIVFVQMATGNDPVLSPKEQAAASRTTASARREVEPTHRREPKPRAEEVEVEPEPEVEELAPEVEEVAPEIEEVAPEIEEVEPEFIEEPLVTSQS